MRVRGIVRIRDSVGVALALSLAITLALDVVFASASASTIVLALVSPLATVGLLIHIKVVTLRTRAAR